MMLMVGSAAVSCNGAKKQADNTEAQDSTFVTPLHVEGLYLLNAKGDTMVLNGPSLGWHSNWGRFYNDSTVMAFKRNWGANITRAAIGAHTSWDVVNCYDADSIDAMNKLYRVIDAAIANDMYVIADWHTHKNTLDNAKKFFTAVTEKYGDTPNILYEIWNEPETVKWDEVKAYAEEIIPLIRKKAPNSVIIVGSPTWDQDVDIASESPLKYDNLLYSLHFYAATHKQPLIDKAEKAIANGLPLVAVNRVGHESDPSGATAGISFWGNSFVAGPQGEFLFRAASDSEVCAVVDVDLQRSENVRRWWPFLRDRRIDAYSGLTSRYLD